MAALQWVLSAHKYARQLTVAVPNPAVYAAIQHLASNDIQIVYGNLQSSGDDRRSIIVQGSNDGNSLYTTVPSDLPYLKYHIRHYVSLHCGGYMPTGTAVAFRVDNGYAMFAPLRDGDMYRSCMAAFDKVPEDALRLHAEIPSNVADPIRAFWQMKTAFHDSVHQ